MDFPTLNDLSHRSKDIFCERSNYMLKNISRGNAALVWRMWEALIDGNLWKRGQTTN